jgi:hypothetical protein
MDGHQLVLSQICGWALNNAMNKNWELPKPWIFRASFWAKSPRNWPGQAIWKLFKGKRRGVSFGKRYGY